MRQLNFCMEIKAERDVSLNPASLLGPQNKLNPGWNIDGQKQNKAKRSTCWVSDGYAHQLCQAETPQENQPWDLGSGSKHTGDCKAVVSGLLCGKLTKWEVAFDIEPYLDGREREEKVHEELWNETFHHLAGRSIIHDFEHMVDKECEIEHGTVHD